LAQCAEKENMKTWHLFLGSAEIVLALVAVFIAVTSSHPQAWFGFVLAGAFGSKGILFILSAMSPRAKKRANKACSGQGAGER
jgi:uncharacterized membrane protein HdeD (DUF308 family)